MIENGKTLMDAAPIRSMVPVKTRAYGVSHGLSEVGYDLRVKQNILYFPPNVFDFMALQEKVDAMLEGTLNALLERAFYGYTIVQDHTGYEVTTLGRVALASSVEEFDMPNNLWAELRNKSTLARRFIDATIGTDAEPGWKGFLTIELIFHGLKPETIPAGSGLCKAVFHQIRNPVGYDGKYQNQPDIPVEAILEAGE